MKELKDRVREAMDYATLSQTKLAIKIGVSKSAVNQLLSGKSLTLKGETAAGIEQATGYSATWLATGKGKKLNVYVDTGSSDEPLEFSTASRQRVEDRPTIEYAGGPRFTTRAPVVIAAKMSPDGQFEESPSSGFVPAYSNDPRLYAVQIKGDALSPAIKSGYYVVVEPGAQPQAGERVMLCLKNGDKMLKEYRYTRAGAVVVSSVLNGPEESIEASDIEWMHAVASIVEPSRWVAE